MPERDTATCGVSICLPVRPSQTSSNPLIPTLKPQSNGPLYSNTVTGTLAVDGWAVTFGTARRGLGGLEPPTPLIAVPKLCNSPHVNGQCTNFTLFDVALQLPLDSKGLSGQDDAGCS